MDQGPRLSEALAEFERDPGWAEHRKVPAAKRRVADTRSPFLCLLSFGEAKESRSPAAATERHRNRAKRVLVQWAKEIRIRTCSSAEPKFATPSACPAGASQRNCDLTPKTRLHAVFLSVLGLQPP